MTDVTKTRDIYGHRLNENVSGTFDRYIGNILGNWTKRFRESQEKVRVFVGEDDYR